MTTDTPRTDAAKTYWDSAERENCVSIVLARELELEAVTYKNEALSLRDSHDLLYRDYQKLEAEVAKLNHQLLKTESNLLQSQDINSFLDTEFRIACKRAEKAEAELAEIKETYASIVQQPHFDEREVHCSCVLALREEVERLKKELDAWDYGTRAKREQEARKKAEAEVERLRSILQNLTDAVTKRLSDDFQPGAARQLWEAFKVASETLDKR